MDVEVNITRVMEPNDEVLAGLNYLLPQLSRSAKPLDLDGLTALLNDESVHLCTCRLDGKIVGSITLVVFQIPTGIRALIEDVVVDEFVRGKSIGLKLVRFALDLAKTYGCVTVDLTSRPEREAANRLYVKVGFQQRNTNVYRYNLSN